MRKLIVLLFSFILLAIPALTLAQAPNLDSLSIPDGLFEKQSYDQQRSQLVNQTIAQIHFYEKYFGQNRTPPSIKVVLSGKDVSNFNPQHPCVNGNAIYLIQTTDDLSNLGKFNSIFLQLIYFNFPNSDQDSAEVIATFLRFKYFNANPSKVAALYRLTNSNHFLYEDSQKNEYNQPFDSTIQMLSVARITQLDTENNLKLKQFLTKSLEVGMKNACQVLGMDFPTFIRSTKLVLPNTKLKPVVEDIERLRITLWSNVHFYANPEDYKSRLDATRNLESAILFVSQGDEVKSRIMLDKVEISISEMANTENIWWFIFVGMLLLVTAGFLFIHNRTLLANVVPYKDIKTTTYLAPKNEAQTPAKTIVNIEPDQPIIKKQKKQSESSPEKKTSATGRSQNMDESSTSAKKTEKRAR